MFLTVAWLTTAAPTFAQSLDQMAGQMILVGFQGDSAADIAPLAEMVAEGRVGGVMYLKTNVASLDAVRAMNARFSSAGAALPPFIALDQEGGSIERLTQAVGFAEIPSAGDVAASRDATAAQALYAGMAGDLADLGFNLNFGPVADVNVNPSNPIIARWERAYSADPAQVTRYARAFVAGHHAANVLTALKHFPGHGSSTGDSHEGFVDITRNWQALELYPFRDLIGSGDADMVMVAHLYHAKFGTDPETRLPSSLSSSWVEGVLRHQLGFNGVVITDDMEMGAIRSQFGMRQSVVQAVRAGVDILLFSNTADYRLSLADEVRAILLDEAEADPAFRERITQSYARIAALKTRLE